jgi:DNA polymerase (family X)
MPATAAGDRIAVARALREIAQRLSLTPGDVRFRARAYERAARTIERTSEDIGRLVAEGRLAELPGVGPALAGVIGELYQTGQSSRLERLRTELPAGVLELAPAIGLPTAQKLHAELGLSTLDELRAACAAGRVREVKGFGPKREAALLERLSQYEGRIAAVRLSEALAEGARLVEHLTSFPKTQAELVGAARRGLETMETIEVLATTPDIGGLRRHIESLPLLLTPVADDDGVSAALPSGSRVRIWVTVPAGRAVALVVRTGSEAHVRKLTALEAPGARAFEDEADVYAAFGLPFIPPELREDRGEIEAARAGRLRTDLIEVEDIVGAVHCHTVASDGRHTLLQMARAAEGRGFRYMTVTDHSPSAHYARGLTIDRLKAQWEEIAQVQEKVKIRLLRGTECDITREGALDWPDAVLDQLEVVIASIHERFKMDASAMTARIVRALRHPVFKIWGHPLGRLIGRRPPFECRIEEILDALAESRGAVEINGDPHRLDLEPRLIPLARARGLRFVISTDAHSTGELANVRYGVIMARRGGLTRDDILNAAPAEAFTDLARPAGSASS